MVARNHQTTLAAHQLLRDGAEALAEVSHTGVRVDKGYLESALRDTGSRIRKLEEELRADPIYQVWLRRYGQKTKLSAPDQLAGVMFEELGITPRSVTATRKRGKADESAFEGVDLPFVKTYFQAQKLRKARGTYLKGIHREMVEQGGRWYVHPSYNLNTVATYRSSCDNPNWQNIPTRNDMMAEMVRRCYIPEPGFQFVEIDYSQIEVRIAACYNLDPVLIAYINDSNSDMHRDLAMQLFFLLQEEVSSKARHLAKNKMVFPEFYGDFYPRCARNMWEAIGFQGVRVGKNNDGPLLHERLAEHGVTEMGACDPDRPPRPGTFEHHVKAIEEDLWGRRFKAYAQWKHDYYAAYLRTGGFQMHSGFAVNGYYKKNDVTNYPIQGFAFHCLLWALVQVVRRLKRYRMRSRVVGQIHDCIVGCVHPAERKDYIDLVRGVMVEEVARHWQEHIIVPLEVEPEVCPVDGTWFDKMKMAHRDGQWEPADLKKWVARYGEWDRQTAR